jgi:plasmid stabilization system protein ParE
MSAVFAWIAADNPAAALNVFQRIQETAENLELLPTGRQGRISGTYEKPVADLPYIIAYALQSRPGGGERLVILRVIHGARDWKKDQWPE